MPPRKRAAARTPDPIDINPDDLDAPVVVPAIIDARAQSAHGGALPAQIVGDDRDTLLRRLTIAAFIVLGVMFLAMIYEGVTQQGHRLRTAEHERSALISAVQTLTTDVNNNAADLRAMRKVLQRQNAILKAAGLTPATIPSLRSGGGGASDGGQSSTPRSQPTPNASPSSSPHSSPSSRPSPSPQPSPSPVVEVCIPGLPCIRPSRAVASSDLWAVHWETGGYWRAWL